MGRKNDTKGDGIFILIIVLMIGYAGVSLLAKLSTLTFGG